MPTAVGSIHRIVYIVASIGSLSFPLESQRSADRWLSSGNDNDPIDATMYTIRCMEPTAVGIVSEDHLAYETRYEELFATDKDGNLSQRVPLPDLVSVLV